MKNILVLAMVVVINLFHCNFASARQIMAECQTILHDSSANRVNNIKLAAKSINLVVYPNQEFSFNKVVGERTTARGYKKAIAFFKGKKVPSVGGGICQVSSTLYSAIRDMKHGIEIVERHAHSLPISYLPKGKDATVSWGTKDFRFINRFPFPLHITAGVEGKWVWVKIYENN